MGKELKIGVAVVGTLAMVFCGVLYQRVTKLKKNPAAVTRNDDKPSDKKSLFGSPEKLTAVAAKNEPSTDDAPAATARTEEPAPPRASFLPSEEAPQSSDDRYASRHSEPAAEANADSAEMAEGAPETSDVVAESPAAEPSTVTNPFARSTPVEAATAEPTPPEPEETAAQDESFGHVASEEAAPADPAMDESAAPARLDDNTVHTAAAADAAPATGPNIYDRPASRFITPPEEEPVAASSPRYSTPTATQSPTSRPAARKGIANGKHTVGPNENFWTISESAYGTGGYFKALHAYNAERYPVADELTVGDEVMVPPQTDLERQFPQLCPKSGRRPTNKSYAVQASAKLQADGNTYVVQEGDTLFDIARYELGKASRWAELYEMNRDVIGDDIDFLRAGMELVLPDDNGKSDSVTRQPGSALQR